MTRSTRKACGSRDSLSGVGSEGVLADRYIHLVLGYAEQHRLGAVVDGGCGDFSVGSRLAPSFERYIALDVSPHIIGINQKRFAGLTSQGRVSFAVADMTATTFPPTDLILIRQVLQHLTNAQIERILVNLEASQWRRVLISESVCDPENGQRPNIDLPSHSVRSRGSLGSGVFIDREPFSRRARRLTTIPIGGGAGETTGGGLMIFELTRDA